MISCLASGETEPSERFQEFWNPRKTSVPVANPTKPRTKSRKELWQYFVCYYSKLSQTDTRESAKHSDGAGVPVQRLLILG